MTLSPPRTRGAVLVDATQAAPADYSAYDRIGLASGVYGSRPAKALMEYAKENLPAGKPVFFVLTSSMCLESFFKPFGKLAEEKGCTVIGRYQCKGYDTFGPFKLVGGVAKGHPDQSEIDAAAEFYKGLS